MKQVRHTLQEGQRLATGSGEETKFIFIRDIEYRKYGKTTRRIIEVQCDCGRTKEVQYNNVRGGFSTCCGYSPCKRPSNEGKRNEETTYNALLYAYKSGAQERGFSFELDMRQFKEFLSRNCFYCDDPPASVYQIKNSKTGEIRAGVPVTYNGIDRIDNKQGYTMENSVTCCETCNRMKRSHEYDKFLSQVEKIYNHRIKSRK